MAYQPVYMVPRLSVYSAGWQQMQQDLQVQKYYDHLSGQRYVAWRRAALSGLGRT